MSLPDVQETIELQLSEIELLQSMFPGEGEFSIDDPSAVSDARKFLDGDADPVGVDNDGRPTEQGATPVHVCPRQLSFSVHIIVGEGEDLSSRVEMELQCSLPLEYPKTLPELNVQSNSLSRQQYKELNDDLKEHLQGLDRGELCITEAIQWLQENSTDYITPDVPEAEKEQSATIKTPSSFTRLWIHSHHIYSRSKRENIFEWAKERRLTGFSLPGKPGIICVEGPQGDVDEFWHKIRRLNWKKLTSKHREDFTSTVECSESNLTDLRRFLDFQEINFDVRGSRDYHMDLGQFFQYLEKHQCADVFKILLGVDGRVSQKDT